jgi:dihydroorotase
MEKITITRPDDWHIHLRNGPMMKTVVPFTANVFARAIIMPNLVPPVTDVNIAKIYHQEICDAVPDGVHFEPLMTLYLTDNTTPEMIKATAESGIVKACKLYPAGATTNSDSGVTDISKIKSTLTAMQEYGLLLLVHGEVTHDDVDIFDREACFYKDIMAKIVSDYPNLKIVCEHITTSEAVDFVLNASDNVAATITPQHLMFNRNHMLIGGVKPHYYCLPILKRSTHTDALRTAVKSGSKKFFLGTDSAPHTQDAKESSCGCAGCFSAVSAIEFYTQVFEDLDCLENLEAFASFNGPDFYGLARNTDKITLVRESWKIPKKLKVDDKLLVPLEAGQTIHWKVQQ